MFRLVKWSQNKGVLVNRFYHSYANAVSDAHTLWDQHRAFNGKLVIEYNKRYPYSNDVRESGPATFEYSHDRMHIETADGTHFDVSPIIFQDDEDGILKHWRTRET